MVSSHKDELMIARCMQGAPRLSKGCKFKFNAQATDSSCDFRPTPNFLSPFLSPLRDGWLNVLPPLLLCRKNKTKTRCVWKYLNTTSATHEQIKTPSLPLNGQQKWAGPAGRNVTEKANTHGTLLLQKSSSLLGMVVHACNPSLKRLKEEN
jgi:hypothetical protein